MVRRAFPLAIQLESRAHRWDCFHAGFPTTCLTWQGGYPLTWRWTNSPEAEWLWIDILQAELDLRWVWVASISTDGRVNCCPWNCHIDTLHSYSGGSAMSHLTLALGQPKTLKQHPSSRDHSLFALSSSDILGAWDCDPTAGSWQYGLSKRGVAPHQLPALTLILVETAVERGAYDARTWHRKIRNVKMLGYLSFVGGVSCLCALQWFRVHSDAS